MFNNMMDYKRYKINYFLPPEPCFEWAGKDHVEAAPLWCSVDLRDGNQALVVPMNLDQKLRYFNLLLRMGFKEIEIGFPAASETEYLFCRTLIEKNLIPDDVTIQVLTQAREHIIRRTYEAIRGAPRAIMHLYNSVSPVQRRQVFRKSKSDVLRMATEGAAMLLEYAGESDTSIRFEYSPENFTATEPEYALEVCNRVLDVWKPVLSGHPIVNLPATMELSGPHVFAQQVEYICKYLQNRENVIVSVHPHNDRGCSAAAAELAVLAGAQRVEGTLFGNGERAGNTDLVTVSMNLYAQGTDPKLNLSDLPEIVSVYEECTGMTVGDRAPYAGRLDFTAFSGSHQDAVAKGLRWVKEKRPEHWDVPYLPIDPEDVGISCDLDVIRINAQSGKGGVGFILRTKYGLMLPPDMMEAVGQAVKLVSDRKHKELTPEEVFHIFKQEYEGITSPVSISEMHFKQLESGCIEARVTTALDDGPKTELAAEGNGRLNAVSNALKKAYGLAYTLETYYVHALEKSSSSRAIAYVGLTWENGEMTWGAGLSTDIICASAEALVTAINNRCISCHEVIP